VPPCGLVGPQLEIENRRANPATAAHATVLLEAVATNLLPARLIRRWRNGTMDNGSDAGKALLVFHPKFLPFCQWRSIAAWATGAGGRLQARAADVANSCMQPRAPHRHHLLQLRAADSGLVIRAALWVRSSSAGPQSGARLPQSMPWGLDRCAVMFQGSNANAGSRRGALRPSSFSFRNRDKNGNCLCNTLNLGLVQLPAKSTHPRPLPLYWLPFSRATGYLAAMSSRNPTHLPLSATFQTWGGGECECPSQAAQRSSDPEAVPRH